MRVYTMYSRGRAVGSCGSSSPFHESSNVFFFLSKLNGEIAHRQRLNNVFFIVLVGNELQNSFVDGTSHCKFKVRIMS